MSDLTVRNFEKEAEQGGGDFLDFSKPEAPEQPDTPEVIDITGEGGEPVNLADDPTDLVIKKPTEEVVDKKEGDGKSPENSSLTPTPEVPEGKEIVTPAATDENTLKYLNEKLGTDYKSLEDVKKAKETVDNPLDSDPYLKSLYEWRQRTGRTFEEFQKFQADTSQMTDIEAARVLLENKYPTFTPEEIDLELSRNIPEEYENDRDAAIKNLELKKLATSGRELMAKFKAELDTPSDTMYSPEVKEKLEFVETLQQNAAIQKEATQKYTENIAARSMETDSFEMNLGDDLKINFKIPEQGKKELPDLIDTMPHWHNEDGSWNHQAVVNDGIKIKYFDQLIKLAYEQGKSSGTESVIKTGKNTNFTNIDPIEGQSEGNKGVQIEGLDEQLGNNGARMRFFKK